MRDSRGGRGAWRARRGRPSAERARGRFGHAARPGDGAAAAAVEKRRSALKRGLFLAWFHARHRAPPRALGGGAAWRRRHAAVRAGGGFLEAQATRHAASLMSSSVGAVAVSRLCAIIVDADS